MVELKDMTREELLTVIEIKDQIIADQKRNNKLSRTYQRNTREKRLVFLSPIVINLGHMFHFLYNGGKKHYFLIVVVNCVKLRNRQGISAYACFYCISRSCKILNKPILITCKGCLIRRFR